ncbi:MAG TPA: glycosyltransferase [Pseudobdellovibrionaceae bacterium]|nr:glycosyltransferase [Pseudobdellovibrionaceae bacterium]
MTILQLIQNFFQTHDHQFFYLFLGYFLYANSIYLVLLALAVVSVRKQIRMRPLIDLLQSGLPSFAPSISVIAPAYNEEKTIVESVRSLLLIHYSNFDIVIVSDGSKDGTVELLKSAFLMKEVELPYDGSLSSTTIRATYRSLLHPNLVLVDKLNGGKADALNVGIGFAPSQLICCVDSDSILEETSLIRVAAPFMEEPDTVIASGGTIRIANGATIKNGRVVDVQIPKSYLILVQIIEYTRAFLCGRIGWNTVNSTLVISGAFGLFNKARVIEVGGYRADCIGEDMDLVIRLHRHCRKNNYDYKIVFVPDPVCWTEVPSTLSVLKRQRDRWQRGLADSLRQNYQIFLNPSYGWIGFLAFPYLLLVELLGPVVEMLSLVYILSGVFFGTASPQSLALVLLASIFYSAVISMGSIVIEEIYFSKYGQVRQFLMLFFGSLLESLGFKQLTSFWRFLALFKYAMGDKSWGKMRRTGFERKEP